MMKWSLSDAHSAKPDGLYSWIIRFVYSLWVKNCQSSVGRFSMKETADVKVKFLVCVFSAQLTNVF